MLSCEGGLSQHGRATYAEQFAKAMSELGYDVRVNSFKAEVFNGNRPDNNRIVSTVLYSPPEEKGKLYFCCFDKEDSAYLDNLDNDIKQYTTKLSALNFDIITVRDKHEASLIKLLTENGHREYKTIDLTSRQEINLLLKKLDSNVAKQWDAAYEREIGPLIEKYLELDNQHQAARVTRNNFYRLNARVETGDARAELDKEQYAIHYKPEPKLLDKMKIGIKNLFSKESKEKSSTKDAGLIASSMRQMVVGLDGEEQARQAAMNREVSSSSTSSGKAEQISSAKATTAALNNRRITSSSSTEERKVTEPSNFKM